MANINLGYLDSCFFISVITPVYHRLPALVPLLKLIDSGKFTAITSAITIAEVRQYKPDPDKPEQYVNAVQAARVREMWTSGRIIVRPVTEFISVRAAEIGNEHPDLLPMDCLHIATAEFHKVDILFTFDGEAKNRRRPEKMIYYDNKIGVPPLRICEPFVPMGEMFDLPKINGLERRENPTLPKPSELDFVAERLEKATALAKSQSLGPGTRATHSTGAVSSANGGNQSSPSTLAQKKSSGPQSIADERSSAQESEAPAATKEA